MKSPIKLENDIGSSAHLGNFQKQKKVTLMVVLVLVVLVVVSWASQGFAFNETRSTEYGNNPSQIFGYGATMTTNVNYSEGEHNKI